MSGLGELAPLPGYNEVTQSPPPILSSPGWCQRKSSREPVLSSPPGSNKLHPAHTFNVSGQHVGEPGPPLPQAVVRHPLTLLPGVYQRRPHGESGLLPPRCGNEATPSHGVSWGHMETATRHFYLSQPEGYQRKPTEVPELPLPHSNKEARTLNVNSLSEKPGHLLPLGSNKAMPPPSLAKAVGKKASKNRQFN